MVFSSTITLLSLLAVAFFAELLTFEHLYHVHRCTNLCKIVCAVSY